MTRGTRLRRSVRGGDGDRARLISGAARAAFAQMMDEHHYTDLLEYASPRFVLVEAASRYKKKSFRCFIGESQKEALRSMEAALACSFSLTTAGWRGTLSRGDQRLGCIRRHGEDTVFEANGERIMALRIGSKSSDSVCCYKLSFGGQEFDHDIPQWNRRRKYHTLKYDLLDTEESGIGIASCKNFRMSCQGKSVLEYLRLDQRRMLVGVAPPFNAFIAAVIGIMRFRQ